MATTTLAAIRPVPTGNRRPLLAVVALLAAGALTSTPLQAQTCWVYSDAIDAPVPLKCVQKSDQTTACAWPQDCTAVTAPAAQTILDMHTTWHDCFGATGGSTPPAGRGQRWYAFHRQLEFDYNAWRRPLSLPPVESLEWCPGMNLPVGTGPQLNLGDHPKNCGTRPPRPDNTDCPTCLAFPQCLFHPGGGPSACPSAPSSTCGGPSGVSLPHTSLDQFANVDEVSLILDDYFHGSMHGQVGLADRGGPTCTFGPPQNFSSCYNIDVVDPECATRDPMFWRLHQALDDVVRAWQDSKAVDVVLVVDRSGSMSDPDSSGATKLQAALTAVDNFADLLENNRPDGQSNRIGVVSYADSASLDMPLTVADASLRAPGGPLATAINAITSTGATGCTGIGGALQKALEVLCPPGNCQGFSASGDNDHKAILLLTDGVENVAPCLKPAGPSGGTCGTQCFGSPFDYDKLQFTQLVSVGFGSAGSLNTGLLTLLAERQGGVYMQNPGAPGDDLKDFFVKAFGQLTDEFLLYDPRGLLGPNDAVSTPVEYTACDDGKITFASGWQHDATPGELRLLVDAPSGRLVPRAAAGVEASEDKTWDFVRIRLPFQGATSGTWRAQLVRPHQAYVNGFTPDAFRDPSAGTTLVRRQIHRLCPDGCRRVLFFEKGRRGPTSAYERAVKAEREAGLLSAVEVARDSAGLARALDRGRWDLIVYAHMDKDVAEPYDQRLAGQICEGTRAIVTDTRRVAAGILRCAGALRDGSDNWTRIDGGGDLVDDALDLADPGHPVFSYGVRPTGVGLQATAQGGKEGAVSAKVQPGKPHPWFVDVLGRSLSKLTPFRRTLEHRTGDDLVATARILPSYNPSGGYDHVDARVEVEYPTVGTGSLLARRGLPKEGRVVRGERIDPRAAAIASLQVPTGTAVFPLVDDGTGADLHAGNGHWTGVLRGLSATDGTYKLRYLFDLTKNGCTTHREMVETLYVDVAVDPGRSNPKVVSQSSLPDGSVRTVLRLRPADAFGNLWGPGRATTVACGPATRCRVDADGVVDHGDGTYTLTFTTPPGASGTRLEAFGGSFDVATPCDRCPRLAGLTVSTAQPVEHSSLEATVTLSSPAPAGGGVVYLESSNRGAATVPASVTVAAGDSAARFTVKVQHAHNGPAPAEIAAVYGGQRKTAKLLVLPMPRHTFDPGRVKELPGYLHGGHVPKPKTEGSPEP